MQAHTFRLLEKNTHPTEKGTVVQWVYDHHHLFDCSALDKPRGYRCNHQDADFHFSKCANYVPYPPWMNELPPRPQISAPRPPIDNNGRRGAISGPSGEANRRVHLDDSSADAEGGADRPRPVRRSRRPA